MTELNKTGRICVNAQNDQEPRELLRQGRLSGWFCGTRVFFCFSAKLILGSDKYPYVLPAKCHLHTDYSFVLEDLSTFLSIKVDLRQMVKWEKGKCFISFKVVNRKCIELQSVWVLVTIGA